MNLLPTIVAKSDQLNADDLVGGPRTITVTGVKGSDSPEQPVWIHFEGDDGKPFKPCKTCRRLLVHCWGPEASDFIGRRMTLYTDPNVMFGGVKTGGIRISHVSHIEREMAVALMVTRGKRQPYVVKPLRAETAALPRREARDDGDFPGDRPSAARQPPAAQGQQASLADRAAAFERRIADAPSITKLRSYRAAATALLADLDVADPERKIELEEAFEARLIALEDAERAARDQ